MKRSKAKSRPCAGNWPTRNWTGWPSISAHGPSSTNCRLQTYDHIVVLAYSDTLDAQRADALTLLTLLHVRRIADENHHHYSIVSEILDQRNRELAESSRADDFIVSDRLVSLLMAQVSENKALNEVFNDLFDPIGAEIFLKPAMNYIQAGVTDLVLYGRRSRPPARRSGDRLPRQRPRIRRRARLWRRRESPQVPGGHLRPRRSGDRAGGGLILVKATA